MFYRATTVTFPADTISPEVFVHLKCNEKIPGVKTFNKKLYFQMIKRRSQSRMYAKHGMFNHHIADTLGYREISDACMWSVRVPGLKNWEMFLNWRQPIAPEIWGK